MNPPIPGPRSTRIVEEEQRHMSPGLQSIALYSGLAMAQGTGCTLIDEDGNRYIDFVAGIGVGSVGHCHPHYVESLKRQIEQLTFGSFTTEVRARFLNLLASVTPPGLSRIQLFSGGAEAVEAAFRLAKSATRRYEFIGFWGASMGRPAESWASSEMTSKNSSGRTCRASIRRPMPIVIAARGS